MKIYVRYVLFGVVKIFTFALFISTFLLLFLLVAETTFGSKVPLSLAFQLIPYLIPEIFSMALPVASLLAVTVFFARMRSNNELIALKSMGIAPWRVLVPVWIFMTGVSVFGIWCNDLSISWTRMQITHVLLEGFETTLLNQLRTEKRFVTPTGQYEIKVSDVTEDGVLLNPEFSGKIGGINGAAESAKIEVDFNVENPVVHIHLTNAEVEATPGQGFLQASYDFPIPLTEVYRSKKRVDPPATKVKEALENLEAKHKAYHRALASNAMFAFLCGNLNGTANEDWKNRAETEKHFFRQQCRYKHTIPRITAAGFSCFFFVWIGAPIAILWKKADFTFAFFASFSISVLLYYPLYTIGLQAAKTGTLPPTATWMGNVALGILGIFLLKKIH
jgi:lipopolysaccharide export system permease protein